jgi:hypothetical protein
VGVREGTPVEQAVQQERPEGVVGREDKKIPLPATALQTAEGALQPKLLVATEGKVRHHVELDPAILTLVIPDIEAV